MADGRWQFQLTADSRLFLLRREVRGFVLALVQFLFLRPQNQKQGAIPPHTKKITEPGYWVAGRCWCVCVCVCVCHTYALFVSVSVRVGGVSGESGG